MAPSAKKHAPRKRTQSEAARRMRETVARRRDAGWHHVQVWVPTAENSKILQRLASDMRDGRPLRLPGPGADPLAGHSVEVSDLAGLAADTLERALRILRSGDARAIQRLAQRVALTEDLVYPDTPSMAAERGTEEHAA